MTSPQREGGALQVAVGICGCFAESSAELGRTNLIKHSIDTGNEHPIRQPCRRVPPARREQARGLIKDML